MWIPPDLSRRCHSDAHTLLFASLAILCGYQCILFAVFAKTFAVTEGFLPPDRNLERFFEIVNLERGLAVAAVALLADRRITSGCNSPMVADGVWPPGLRLHHAVRRPGSDPCRARPPNRLLQFFRQHSGYAPEVTGKKGSDEIAGLVQVSKVIFLILRHANET